MHFTEPVDDSDPQYQAAVDGEIKFWSREHIFGADIEGARDSSFNRYTNARFTGDASRFWYETISAFGPFRKGLVLGAGGVSQEADILQSNPDVHLTFYDLTPEQTTARQEHLSPRFANRFVAESVDLNFVEIPSNTYDLIVSSGTLHHIINLDRLALQINNALTRDGYFFLQDYVGESRFEFSDEKKRVFEGLWTRAESQAGREPPRSLRWAKFDAEGGVHSPFEAIRSGETLEILRNRLVQSQLRTMGAVVGVMLFARPESQDAAAPEQPKRNLIEKLRSRVEGRRRGVPAHEAELAAFREFFLFDEVLSDAGVLTPTNAFGIYRKKTSA